PAQDRRRRVSGRRPHAPPDRAQRRGRGGVEGVGRDLVTPATMVPMPTLPTLTVSQDHFDRIVAAFPGATPDDKVAAYRAWLINGLIAQVASVEAHNINAELARERTRRRQELLKSLP